VGFIPCSGRGGKRGQGRFRVAQGEGCKAFRMAQGGAQAGLYGVPSDALGDVFRRRRTAQTRAEGGWAAQHKVRREGRMKYS